MEIAEVWTVSAKTVKYAKRTFYLRGHPIQAAPTPPEEEQRLATLRALGILDTAAEARFDAITRAAAGLFGMPIVLVSLVDAHRQWFKSRHGLEASQTPRDVSFCGHAILSDETFIIEDAFADPRFADNPLVTGAPNVRFYAGRPLAAPDGMRIGTLCLIDTAPRKLTAEQRIGLAVLGAWAEAEIALVAERRISRQFLDRILECTKDAVLVVGATNAVRLANPAALALLRTSREGLEGIALDSLVEGQDRDTLNARLAGMPCTPGEWGTLDVEVALRRGDGSVLPATLCCTRRTSAGDDATVVFLRPRSTGGNP